MESRVKFLGHPVHQMLVVFPVGLLGTSVVFEGLHLWLDGSGRMATVAYYLISAGLISGLVAAPFGTIDWLAIPRGTRARSVGAAHGLGNLAVVALFGVSWWLRRDLVEAPPVLASVLAFAGGGLALVTAWLGGELVDRLGIGVSDSAAVNAPSSLRASPTPKHRYP
jgi:uncharacterized membrane protein